MQHGQPADAGVEHAPIGRVRGSPLEALRDVAGTHCAPFQLKTWRAALRGAG